MKTDDRKNGPQGERASGRGPKKESPKKEGPRRKARGGRGPKKQGLKKKQLGNRGVKRGT